MKAHAVAVGLAAALLLTACWGSDKSDGTHTPTPTVAATTTSGTSTTAPPSPMSSAEVAFHESVAAQQVMGKLKDAGGPVPKEVVKVSFQPPRYKVAVTLHVASVKTGVTGTVLTFWLTSSGIDHAMAVANPEDFPSLVDTAGGVKYSVDSLSTGKDTPLVVGSEDPEIGPDGVYLMQAAYPPLPDSVKKVKISVGSAKTSPDVPVTR